MSADPLGVHTFGQPGPYRAGIMARPPNGVKGDCALRIRDRECALLGRLTLRSRASPCIIQATRPIPNIPFEEAHSWLARKPPRPPPTLSLSIPANTSASSTRSPGDTG